MNSTQMRGFVPADAISRTVNEVDPISSSYSVEEGREYDETPDVEEINESIKLTF